ncbi:MAG: hypothetical protein M0011_10725 [Elusimicrobia bacterium]|nr:hypothetical protein [Elusimicrobiota bacterium]
MSAAARTARITATAAVLLVCGLRAGAAEGDPADRLAAYELAIASANPAAAAAYLRDGEARELAQADPRKSAELLGKAEALKDLKDLLNMDWDDAKVNQLNKSLAIRIDVEKPLSLLGVGPEPEKLLSWLVRYAPRYPAAKKAAVRKAIRQWEVVFGTMTDTRTMKWGQAGWQNITKANWEGMVLRERNAVIEKLIARDPSFLIYNDERLAAEKDRVAVAAALIQVKNSGALSPAQLSQLSGKSFDDQLYLLGNMFDNSDIAVSQDLKNKINSARSSLPGEVLPYQQRQLLGGMLNTAVTKELSGTQAGARALSAFPGGLKITVAPVQGAYSRYDASTGGIVLDSETIQQYMRVKGYTADSLMRSPEQVAEIAKYMSPAVVYESAHKMQADWAVSRGIYLPQVQENEIEAMSLEGLYTTEKMQKDRKFKDILTSSREFSSYAAKKMDVGTQYQKRGSKGFAITVRQLYSAGLPSLSTAAAHVLGAVTSELERRETMPAAEKSALDSGGLSLSETLEMSPEELAYSVKEIQTPVLVKIQGDLSNLGTYRSRYAASDRQGRKSLKALERGTASAGAAVPPLTI